MNVINPEEQIDSYITDIMIMQGIDAEGLRTRGCSESKIIICVLSSKQPYFRLNRCPTLTQPLVIPHRLVSKRNDVQKHFFFSN